MKPTFVAAPLLLIFALLALAGVTVFVVLMLRRHRPSRGFEVKRVLPLDQGERRE